MSNYRGAKVSGIDESDISNVLVTLARAAISLGKLPFQSGDAGQVYVQLAEVLDQLGRFEKITSL